MTAARRRGPTVGDAARCLLGPALDRLRRRLQRWLAEDFPWPPPAPATAPSLIALEPDETMTYRGTLQFPAADASLTRRTSLNVNGADREPVEQPADAPTLDVPGLAVGDTIVAAYRYVRGGIAGAPSPALSVAVAPPPPTPAAAPILVALVEEADPSAP